MTPFLFPLLHLLRTDQFTSGELMSGQLGCSRARISQLVAEAATLGVEVERVRNRGYRLLHSIDWLNAETIVDQLACLPKAHPARSWQVVCQMVVDSTNLQMHASALQGGAHGRVLAAEMQTAGKGRLGRRWQAAPGGSLLFSVLWRLPLSIAELAGLPLLVGLAVAEVLRDAGVPAELKWPNDILLHGCKLGGVLLETQGEAGGPVTVVVGVGLNVFLPPALRDDIEQAVADLSHYPQVGSRTQLLGQILARLAEHQQTFMQHGFAPFAPRWAAFDAYIDREVDIVRSGKVAMTGRVEGIDEHGGLRLQSRDGLFCVRTGELSLRPRQLGVKHA